MYLEDNAETTTAVDTVLRTVSFPSSKVLLNQAELWLESKESERPISSGDRWYSKMHLTSLAPTPTTLSC